MTSTDYSEFYRPSRVVVLLKGVMRGLRRILPRRLYWRVHEFLFAVYRRVLRVLYFRRVLIPFLSGDRAEIARRMLVWRVMPYSLVGTSGLEATHDVVQSVLDRDVPGDLVECGVAQGGSAAIMGLLMSRAGASRTLWLFDSFEGLPPPTAKDFEDGVTGRHLRELPPGSCLGTVEQVSELLFDDLELPRGRVMLVEGWFQDTLPAMVPVMGSLAMLRIDGDWYESVRCCLEHLYDNVSPGGYVIIDDYGTCYGARRALDEFLAERRVSVELEADGRGGVAFRKPSKQTPHGG